MSLPSAALRALIDGLATLYSPCPAEEFPGRAVAVASELFGVESCSYNHIVGGKLAAHHVTPAGRGDFPGALEAFDAHLFEHPVLVHLNTTGDMEAHRISDFLSDRQFRALGLYRNFYRFAGVDYQLDFAAPASNGGLIAIALNRVGTDFTDNELELARLLRPHLGQAASTAALLSVSQPDACPVTAPDGTPLLTPRQTKVLELVAAGQPDRAIARSLGISTRTVHTHLQHIYRTLNVTSRTEALAQLRTLAQPAVQLAPAQPALAEPRPAQPAPGQPKPGQPKPPGVLARGPAGPSMRP